LHGTRRVVFDGFLLVFADGDVIGRVGKLFDDNLQGGHNQLSLFEHQTEQSVLFNACIDYCLEIFFRPKLLDFKFVVKFKDAISTNIDDFELLGHGLHQF